MGVFPSPKVSDTVVEPYNAVLSCHQLLDLADSTFILDNEALFNISHNVLKEREPKLDNLNNIINQALMGVTAPFRFPASSDSTLRKQNANLCAFPRLHFFSLSHSPYIAMNANSADPSLDDLLRVCGFSNLLSNVKWADGKLLAASCYFRGPYALGERVFQKIDLDEQMEFAQW